MISQNPDPKFLHLITLRLSNNETEDGRQELNSWLKENKVHFNTFHQIKEAWENNASSSSPLNLLFNRKYIAQGLIRETIGSLVGFAIGLWISNSFTHYVKERRNIKNLYGVLGRKQVVVNVIPEWMQFCLSVLLGFIALELIKYFLQRKNHLFIVRYISKFF